MIRWKDLWILCLGSVITACGKPPPNDPEFDFHLETLERRDGEWDMREESDVELPTPRSSVHAVPNTLMFYGDLNADGSLGPQELLVENATSSAVAIVGAEIIHDATLIGSEDDAEFFETDPPDQMPTLARGDYARFTVRFRRSPEQRHAILVIHTTHTSFPEIRVPLHGKLFLGHF